MMFPSRSNHERLFGEGDQGRSPFLFAITPLVI